MKYRIYIGSSELEVDDISYPIDLAFLDLSNADTHRSNKSKLIRIPATAANQAILGRLEDVNISRTISGVEGRIEYGNFVLRGTVKFYDVEIEDGRAFYNIQIISGNGDWVKQIESKMITELDLDIEHTYDEATINDSETNGGDYFYPLTNYGQFTGQTRVLGDSVLVEDRLPATKLFAIFYQIFKEIGYKISSSFITAASGSDFIKYFMSFGRNPEVYSKDFCDDKLFCAGLSGTFEAVHSVIPLYNGSILLWDPDDNALISFDDDSTSPNFDNGDNYDTTTFAFTADYAMAYRFYSKIYIYMFWGPNLHLTNVIFTISILKNGSTVLDTASDSELTDSQNTLNYYCNLELDTKYQTLADGDDITVKITVRGNVVNNSSTETEDITLNIVPDDEVYFKNQVSQRPTRGYEWTVEKMLPDVSQLDFVKAVAHIFNLRFTTNMRERTVYIERWDSFFSATVNSWSSKLDTLRHARILAKEIPTFLNYRMKNDRNDAEIINYFTEVKFSNGNGESEISENNLFADTLMDYCYDIGFNVSKIPKLWSKRGVFGDTPEQDMNFSPRIFYYDGQTELPSGEAWYFEGVLKSTYPKVTSYNFEEFIAYRTNMHKLMNNSQILEAYFHLTEVDINNIGNAISGKDFRSPVYLDDALYKGQYLINKISGWTPEETCQVQLVQFRKIAAGVSVRQVEILNEGASDSGDGSSLKSDQILMTCLIVDPDIIAMITNDSNWIDQDYIGTTAGLEECNYYVDWDNKIKYFFDGLHLVRFFINTVL